MQEGTAGEPWRLETTIQDDWQRSEWLTDKARAVDMSSERPSLVMASTA